jgi:uncharacterized protein YacL
MVVLGIIGWRVGIFLAGRTDTPLIRYVLVLSLAGSALGLLLTPYVTTRPFRWLRRKIRQLPARQLVAAIVGLVVGLIISALLAFPLSFLPSPFGEILPFVSTIIFGYLGMSVMLMRQQDIFSLFGERFSQESLAGEGAFILLDTSVIIDGRIADISKTGFIHGTMLVPRFVLNEIQRIADSSDALRRNRGRRGLDMLNKLQKEAVIPVRITDMDVEEVRGVDEKLVLLAKNLRCPIITNDYNLNKVAQLQGVTALNVNELANALKPIFLPGESLRLRVIQEGKEADQGVGYLDDGTMVVVEGGRRYIGSTIKVTVAKVLQTTAGRMIFAKPEE